jgi:hypothetical protein
MIGLELVKADKTYATIYVEKHSGTPDNNCGCREVVHLHRIGYTRWVWIRSWWMSEIMAESLIKYKIYVT